MKGTAEPHTNRTAGQFEVLSVGKKGWILLQTFRLIIIFIHSIEKILSCENYKPLTMVPNRFMGTLHYHLSCESFSFLLSDAN